MYNELNELNTNTIEQKIIDFMLLNKIELEFVKKIESFQVDKYFYRILNNAKINKINSVIDELQIYIQVEKIILDVDNLSGCIVFELSKQNRDILYFKDLKDNQKDGLTACIGKDTNSEEVNIDLSKAPHLLIAGATGSGKSCIINNIITSINNKYDENYFRMILVDVKKVEFLQYNNSKTLATPVITDIVKALSILNKMCNIMDARYNYLAEKGYKNIQDHNKNELEKMFYYMIVIDEFSDLILQAPEIEQAIIRLAQLGRACGIHLIIATQRPSSKVLTGLIKTNIPMRLALSVSSIYDSRIILDCKGAEKLTGKGDFLLKYPNGEMIRGQAALID